MLPENREFLENCSKVAQFLYGASVANYRINGIDGREALASFCKVLNIDEATLMLKFGGFIK